MSGEQSSASPVNEVICGDVTSLQHDPDLLVNPSQLEAVKLALKNRLALIQGPPGYYKK